MLSTQKYFEMNRQVEYHYNNTGFPLESYIYLFEGPPYNYAELYAQESMYRSMSMHTVSNKFEPSSSGNTSYFGYVHAHEEDDCVPESVEEPEPSATHARENSNPTAPGSPEECIRSHSDASSSQVFWQDNIDVDNMTYEELLELGEAVGTQSRGLSQELISSLPVSKYKSGGFFSRKKSHGNQCVICQMEYKRRDRQITLPCKHVYHAKCATRWLSINKACPVCYAEVFGKDSRH